MTVPTGADLNGPRDEPEFPDPATAPTPNGHHGAWWPAMVDLPGRPRIPRARVYACPEGLYLWSKAPRPGEQPVPDVWLPILWELTGPKPTSVEARVQGIYIATEYGVVHITPTGGCGCSSGLSKWSPPWSSRSIAGWPAGSQSPDEPGPGTLGQTPAPSPSGPASDELSPPDDTADTDAPTTSGDA